MLLNGLNKMVEIVACMGSVLKDKSEARSVLVGVRKGEWGGQGASRRERTCVCGLD